MDKIAEQCFIEMKVTIIHVRKYYEEAKAKEKSHGSITDKVFLDLR